jgi:Fe-S cluster biogenesis protein NfuA
LPAILENVAVPVIVDLNVEEERFHMQPDLSTQRDQAQRIEALLQVVEAFPDQEARATTEELIQMVLDMYGQGLTRMLELIAQSGATGQDLLAMLAGDELVGALLLLHGLHPQPLAERVAETFNAFQTYLARHGGKAELLCVEQGVAYIHLESTGPGCSSTLQLLQTKLEEVLYQAVPDLEDLRIESAQTPVAQPRPVTFVPRRAKSSPSVEPARTERSVG